MEQQPAEKQTPLEDGDSEQNDLPLIDLESAGQRAPPPTQTRRADRPGPVSRRYGAGHVPGRPVSP